MVDRDLDAALAGHRSSSPESKSIALYRRACVFPEFEGERNLQDITTGIDPSVFGPPRGPEAASDSYGRIMLVKKLGYALWLPEPSTYTKKYETDGITIGDVGVLTFDGRFDFLFNICKPADDPINRHAPPGFVPVDFDYDRDVKVTPGIHPKDCVMTTKTVVRRPFKSDEGSTPRPGRYRFACPPPEGAVLILPEGATRIDHRHRDTFFQYARQNTYSWYAHFNGELGLGAENGALYLVTGADKTSNWGVAAYAGGPRVAALEFASYQGQYAYQSSGIVDGRTAMLPAEGPPLDNQAVFIRGYRVALNKRLFSSRYVGPGGKYNGGLFSTIESYAPDWLWGMMARLWPGEEYTGDRDEDNSGIVVEMFPDLPEPYHPSTTINLNLLDKIPEAKVSIVHDDEWCAVIEGDDVVAPEGPELLRRIYNKYTPKKEGGCVYLVSK